MSAKRCGHRPGKQLVDAGEMVDGVKAAVDARTDESFVDHGAHGRACGRGAGRGDRAREALRRRRRRHDLRRGAATLDEYRRFTSAVDVPVLANLTEFGKTPLFTLDEMREAGVRLVLYPLTAFRAMSAAAARAYETLRRQGTQKELIGAMQTRDELYEMLGYHAYEKKLDELFAREQSDG